MHDRSKSAPQTTAGQHCPVHAGQPTAPQAGAPLTCPAGMGLSSGAPQSAGRRAWLGGVGAATVGLAGLAAHPAPAAAADAAAASTGSDHDGAGQVTDAPTSTVFLSLGGIL